MAELRMLGWSEVVQAGRKRWSCVVCDGGNAGPTNPKSLAAIRTRRDQTR